MAKGISIKPRKLAGRWREGFALDLHTLSSEYIGDNEYGHPQFETTYSEIGELLYLLKYKRDESAVPAMVRAASKFVKNWDPEVDVLIPVPPSKYRRVQPVRILGEALAKRLKIPFGSDWLKKAKKVPELKNVYDYDERADLLEGAHTANAAKLTGRRVLLFDDLYRSGATMNAVTTVLYDEGDVEEVFALTMTKTRSNR